MLVKSTRVLCRPLPRSEGRCTAPSPPPPSLLPRFSTFGRDKIDWTQQQRIVGQFDWDSRGASPVPPRVHQLGPRQSRKFIARLASLAHHFLMSRPRLAVPSIARDAQHSGLTYAPTLAAAQMLGQMMYRCTPEALLTSNLHEGQPRLTNISTCLCSTEMHIPRTYILNRFNSTFALWGQVQTDSDC